MPMDAQEPRTVAAERAAAPRRVAVLSIGSPLFPADAAATTLAMTAAAVGQGGLILLPVTARDPASLALALDRLSPRVLDGLVLQMATFATAEALHALLDWLGPEPLPLAVWALEEAGEIVTNSLCGAQLWCSTLQRLGRRAAFLLGQPGEAALQAELTAFAAGARAARALRGARVALIGSHAAWFTNLAADPWALGRTLGVTVAQVSLPAFLAGCIATPEAAAAAVRRWADVAFDAGDAEANRATLGRSFAQLEAGLDRIAADAIAIRDWPEILYDPEFRGTWAALGELSDRAVPIAPEGDVPGALTALAARAFDPAALPFLTDISGIDRAGDQLVLWHYGVSPRLAAGPRRVDAALKQESFPLRAGPLTLLRLSLRPDGSLRLFLAEGAIAAEPCGANRAAGWFRPARETAEALVRRFIGAGYEHHVTALHGDWGDAVRHLAQALGIALDDA
jgi:L-fucose isomerase-like protein